jgi:iron complex transport system substrate-binding protein
MTELRQVIGLRRIFGMIPTGPTLAAVALAAVSLTLSGGALRAEAPEPDPAPRRVVSINLCTDQLAMLAAAPGQLISVSYFARDDGASALAEQARSIAINHARAEEIYLLEPDLVLAGAYTASATVELLRRVGIRVETFSPSGTFDEIRANIRRMGALLGRDEHAEALVRAFDMRLEALRAHAVRPSPPLAALYYANNYSAGAGSLADEIVRAAGFRNLGREVGILGVAKLPLEVLVMASPDLVLGRDTWDRGPALAYQPLDHPALAAVAGGVAPLDSRYWVCGAPFTATAVEHVVRLRAAIEAEKTGPLAASRAGAPEARP